MTDQFYHLTFPYFFHVFWKFTNFSVYMYGLSMLCTSNWYKKCFVVYNDKVKSSKKTLHLVLINNIIWLVLASMLKEMYSLTECCRFFPHFYLDITDGMIFYTWLLELYLFFCSIRIPAKWPRSSASLTAHNQLL